MNIKLVLEGSSSDDKKRKEMAAKAANAEKAKIARLQAKLEGECRRRRARKVLRPLLGDLGVRVNKLYFTL